MRYSIAPEIITSKKIVFFLLFLFSMTLVLANGMDIGEATITIKINVTEIDEHGNITITVGVIDEYDTNKDSKTFVINNIDPLLLYDSFPFTFFFIKNESVDSTIIERYATCLSKKEKCEVEKGKFDVAWGRCVQDLNKYEGENATSFKEELDTCILLVKEKDLVLTSQDDKITDLKNNEEGTKNSKYLWGIFGAVLAVVGVLFYQGKIGGGVAKEKAMGEFQKSQSG